MTKFPFPDDLRDRYEPLRELGRGGMGVVFLARDRKLDREVVVKFSLDAADPDLAARAEREAKVLASLEHPNVLRVYDAGRTTEGPYLVTEHLVGRPLSEVDGRVPLGPVFRQLADGLAAVHAAGVLHRDLKPANMFLEESDRALLIDFGLVSGTSNTALTRTGQVLGTMSFMAPECLAGRTATSASDWYGWAAAFYACLEGRPPYGGPAMLLHVTEGAPLTLHFEHTPLAAQPSLRLLLDPDPARRPTAPGRELWEVVAPPKPAATEPQSSIRPTPAQVLNVAAMRAAATPPPAPTPGRRVRATGGVLLACLLAGGALLFTLQRRATAPTVPPGPRYEAANSTSHAELTGLVRRRTWTVPDENPMLREYVRLQHAWRDREEIRFRQFGQDYWGAGGKALVITDLSRDLRPRLQGIAASRERYDPEEALAIARSRDLTARERRGLRRTLFGLACLQQLLHRAGEPLDLGLREARHQLLPVVVSPATGPDSPPLASWSEPLPAGNGPLEASVVLRPDSDGMDIPVLHLGEWRIPVLEGPAAAGQTLAWTALLPEEVVTGVASARLVGASLLAPDLDGPAASAGVRSFQLRRLPPGSR